jgi:hypothetical protein
MHPLLPTVGPNWTLSTILKTLSTKEVLRQRSTLKEKGLPEFALLGLLDRERTKVHLAIFFRRGRGYAPRRFTVGFRNRSPTCPSCLDPGLPIHITWHFEIFSGSSSGMISTTCPRLSRNVPMSLNPSGELSTMRQGSLFGIRSRLTTRLAPFFRTIRFDRRFS